MLGALSQEAELPARGRTFCRALRPDSMMIQPAAISSQASQARAAVGALTAMETAALWGGCLVRGSWEGRASVMPSEARRRRQQTAAPSTALHGWPPALVLSALLRHTACLVWRELPDYSAAVPTPLDGPCRRQTAGPVNAERLCYVRPPEAQQSWARVLSTQSAAAGAPAPLSADVPGVSGLPKATNCANY